MVNSMIVLGNKALFRRLEGLGGAYDTDQRARIDASMIYLSRPIHTYAEILADGNIKFFDYDK